MVRISWSRALRNAMASRCLFRRLPAVLDGGAPSYLCCCHSGLFRMISSRTGNAYGGTRNETQWNGSPRIVSKTNHRREENAQRTRIEPPDARLVNEPRTTLGSGLLSTCVPALGHRQ